MARFSRTRFYLAVLMGFSSGLPLVLTRSTLKAWLTEGRVDLKTVGFFTLVAFPYSFKFIWAPAVDRWAPLGLGRRRGWLIVSQLGIIAGLVALALSEPGPDTLGLVALAAAWTAFFGATQDVVIDAYRRETFPDEELGLASSLFVSSYRVALLAAGGGALYLADVFSWRDSYFVMAGLMAASIAVTLVAPEPQVEAAPPKSLRESAIGPLTDFFKRSGAPTILAFILLYKVGEQMASEMFNPFFIQIGFTKTEIAEVAKLYGFWAAIAGGLAGGWAMRRMSVFAALFAFGGLQGAALLLFSLLATVGHNKLYLTWAVGCENFASAMATAAYMAFMASQTNRRFTATQYALLSSLLGAATLLAGSATGILAERLGWSLFFLACIAATLPGLLLLLPLRRLASAR